MLEMLCGNCQTLVGFDPECFHTSCIRTREHKNPEPRRFKTTKQKHSSSTQQGKSVCSPKEKMIHNWLLKWPPAIETAHWVTVLATQACWPEFDPGTHGERRELTPQNCPLTSTPTLWHVLMLTFSSPHVSTCKWINNRLLQFPFYFHSCLASQLISQRFYFHFTLLGLS